MAEWIKIFFLGLLLWRALVVFYRPTYLKALTNSKNAFRFDFGEGSQLIISRTFLWQIFTIIGAFGIVYTIHIEIQKSQYPIYEQKNHKEDNQEYGYGWIVRKGGYLLRKYPMDALIRSNMVIDTPIPSGKRLRIIQRSDESNWYKVQFGEDTDANKVVGFISGKALIEETAAVDSVRKFITNLGQEQKKLACEQLIRWKGKCGDAFIQSPLYGGVYRIDTAGFKLDSVINGRVIINAKYTAYYKQEEYFKLRKTTPCLIQYSDGYDIRAARQSIIDKDLPVGFIYDENFHVIKLDDGSLKIWDHLLKNKDCLPHKSPNRYF